MHEMLHGSNQYLTYILLHSGLKQTDQEAYYTVGREEQNNTFERASSKLISSESAD